MKRSLLCLALIIAFLSMACDDSKRVIKEGEPSLDEDQLALGDDEAILPDGLPDLSDTTSSDDDGIPPGDGDDLLSDQDAISKIACAETGEGCDPTDICLYDWTLQGYYCEDACDPLIADDCPDGMVCEAVEDDANHGCFLPAFIAGRVFDIGDPLSHPPVEGARVSGMDQKSGEATEVSVTDTNGNYRLPLSLARTRTGAPVPGGAYTLRAAAQDYEPYPGTIRVALPILLDNFTRLIEGFFVQSGFLDIGLLPLADEKKGGFILSGTLSEAMSGVLVIARCTEVPCPYTYTGAEGEFVLYNVLPGDYEVAALKSKMSFSAVPVTVVDADITDLLLERIAEPELGSISGSVNIVNAPGGLKTSVVLMAEETFIPGFDKGEIVPGLRAPEPPAEPDVTGGYTITGIPAGRYVVLAAFENDWLVRDPDPNIAGTQVLHLEIPDGDSEWDLTLDNFKVTEAIEIVSPGANGPEQIDGTDLVFIWKDDSSETHYNIKLFNAYGAIVWEKTVPRETGVEQIELAYDGDKLSGYYQWRVTSLKTGAPISTSEDLKGIFYVGMPY